MMDEFWQLLSIIGAVETVILFVGIIWGIVLWFKGITPALFRLGNGLARRKIAVFAKADNLYSIKKLLTDSKLFSKRNIIEISNDGDLGIAEQASVYLVFWPDWQNSIESILAKKKDSHPLIVYAPRNCGPISEENMKNLDGCRNTAVTNFRGRLLNDIVTAMITTSYEKK